MFVAATALHALVFMGLYVVLGCARSRRRGRRSRTQALGNAVVGMVAFTIIEGAAGAMERRRLSRGAGLTGRS